MNRKIIELKSGIKAHFINTDKHKTDLTCIILTTPLKRENVTKNAIIPFLLRRGTEKLPNQYLINKEMENMYGAAFNLGIDKTGDNVVLKFYIETVANEYALYSEDILKMNIENILDIVFNPLKKDGMLKEEFLQIEKENLRKVINSKIDDKDSYAFERCISEMYKQEGFGLYKYGYIEDIDNLTIKDITEYYEWLVDNAKVDIFVSGKIDEDSLEKLLLNNENIKKLNPREGYYIKNSQNIKSKDNIEEKEIFESMNVVQGKLVLGLNIGYEDENLQAIALVYNAILGDGANSMMFQNVREKAGLAYSSKSTFIKQKMNIFIRCGIQIDNYEKALNLIKVQLENIKNGEFTDEDIEVAKIYLISSIKNIEEEQDTEVVYYIGQELSGTNRSVEEYIERIQKVSKEDILALANEVTINTIYFLKN